VEEQCNSTIATVRALQLRAALLANSGIREAELKSMTGNPSSSNLLSRPQYQALYTFYSSTIVWFTFFYFPMEYRLQRMGALERRGLERRRRTSCSSILFKLVQAFYTPILKPNTKIQNPKRLYQWILMRIILIIPSIIKEHLNLWRMFAKFWYNSLWIANFSQQWRRFCRVPINFNCIVCIFRIEFFGSFSEL